jgi:hypothetical protein
MPCKEIIECQQGLDNIFFIFFTMQMIFFTFSVILCVCASAVPMFCCAGQQFYQQAIARGMPAHSLHRQTGEKIEAVHS